MLERYENKFSMHRTVELVLDTNSLIWTPNVGFTAVKTAYSGKLSDIFNVSQQENAVISGIAVDKKVLKKGLVSLTVPVGAAVVALANQINNNQLLAEVNFSETELMRKRDDEIGQICQTIHDKANDNIAALTVMGITAAMLTAQQTAIDVYQAKVPTPGAAKAAKKAFSIQLRTLFKSTDNLVKLELDNLMKQYKTSHPNFYDAYKAARVIHDLGATHTRMRATVKDENNQVIPNASFTLMQGIFTMYQVVSDAEGKVKLTKIKPGTYTIRVQKANFNTYTEEGIVFKAGKEVKRTVILQSGNSPNTGTVVAEGDIAVGTIFNLDTSQLNVTDSTTVKVEVTGGELNIYAAALLDELPGSTFWHLANGTNITKTLVEFAVLIGADENKKKVTLQNPGATTTHYKLTFNNLES